MEISEGDLVTNPKQPEWGVGLVVGPKDVVHGIL